MTTAPADALAGDWDGLVVFCAGTSWDGNRFPDQHMAERLSAYAPVLYVDPPLSPVTARRQPHLAASLEGPRLRLLAPRLARLTPVVLPGMTRPGMRRATRLLHRRAIRRAARRLGGEVAAVVVATLSDVYGACGERQRVFYATDDFVAGAQLMGLPAEHLRALEARILADADLVVAVSPALADSLRARGAHPEIVVNGVDEALFAGVADVPLPDDVDLPAPIAGFVGHLSERIDASLLEAVAARGHSLLLVGPRQPTFDVTRIDRLLARPNVRWVGAKAFEALPGYLRAIDVGLVPYADTEFNRASFPLKTLEYLAAGRPVVATDLPAVRWLGTEHVDVADGPEAFVAAVERHLAAPRDDVQVAARRAVAAANSWDRRAAEFAALLHLA